MKTYVNLWYYLVELFLKWEIFKTEVVEKMKTHVLCLVTFFWKPCHLWDILKKCGGTRQATCDNIIRRTPFACWITKVLHTHTNTHTHTTLRVCNTYCFSTAKTFHESDSVLRYTYIVSCLLWDWRNLTNWREMKTNLKPCSNSRFCKPECMRLFGFQ